MRILEAIASRSLRATRRSVFSMAAVLLALLPWDTGFAQAARTATPAWSDIVAAAKKEGKVTFYYGATPASQGRVIAGFRKAYPDIEVESLRVPSGPLMAKVDQERLGGADGADIVNSTEMGWFTLRANEGVLIKPAGPALAAWPKEWLIDGGNTVVPGVEPIAISYNRNTVKPAPRGYPDLLRPDIKGRLGIVELAATTIVAYYDWIEKTQGAGYLERIKAQNPKFYTSGVTLTQALASGEVDVGLWGVPSDLRLMMEKGAPIDFAMPSPGMGYKFGLAVLGWGKRRNAALVFMDYVMSPDGQAAWHGNGTSASPLPGVPGGLPINAVTPWNPADYPADVTKRYTDRWNRIFK